MSLRYESLDVGRARPFRDFPTSYLVDALEIQHDAGSGYDDALVFELAARVVEAEIERLGT